MSASNLSTEIWEEIILNYLTPRHIGRLECTSKGMKEIIKCSKVWKNQAVLAYNEFYTQLEETDENCESLLINGVKQYFTITCSEYKLRVEAYFSYHQRDTSYWFKWDDIVSDTTEYVTTDPKVVLYNELRKTTIRKIIISYDDITKEFYNQELDEIEESGDGDISDDIGSSSPNFTDYDSDSSWHSFQSSDSIDGQRDWQ